MAEQPKTKCYFSEILEDTHLDGIQCSKPGQEGYYQFRILTKSEQVQLLQRLCLSTMQFNGHDKFICKEHLTKLLGSWFGKEADRNCFWPTHLLNRRVTDKSKLRFISLEVSMILRTHAGTYVPFRTGLCANCRRWQFEPLMTKLKDEGFPPIFQDDSNEYRFSEQSDTSGLSGTASDLSSLSIGHDENIVQDPDYSLPRKELYEEKRKILNQLLEINGRAEECNYSIEKSYFSQSVPNQLKFRTIVAAGIAAVLNTVSNQSDPDGLLWKEIIDSGCMSKALSTPVPPDKLMNEVIIAYNNVGTFSRRIQVLSLVATKVSFKYLKRFNSNLATSEEVGEKAAEADGDGVDDDVTSDPETHHKFNPPLSYHIYRQARFHYNNNGHGLSPVVRASTYVWRVSRETVDAIIDFVSSPLNTQNVAYGTLRVKDPRTDKHQRIARVIRLHTKTELVNQLEKFLEEKGHVVPSRATLFKILSRMPAATIKEMKGIDTVQEYCSRAFTKLEEILSVLKTEAGIDAEIYDNLSSCVSSARTYLKSHYMYNLSIESKCASHCVSLACSDAANGNQNLIRRCRHDHSEPCYHCNQLPTLFSAVFGVLHQNRNKFTPFAFAEMEYEIKEAYDRVNEQRTHLVRTFIQNVEWSRLYHQTIPENGVAFITMDWAMKWLPRQFRETQAEWWAKRGISWHLCVAETMVRKPGTNEIGIRTDVYVSICGNEVSQEATVVGAILVEVLKAYKLHNPAVKKVWLRSDQAGCYKSSHILFPLWFIRNDIIPICGYIFSEAGAGKSRCDQQSAIIKHQVQRSLNSGMNAINPQQFYQCIIKNDGVANVHTMLGNFESFGNGFTFPKVSISAYNHFEFVPEGVRCWMHSTIGTGVLVKMKQDDHGLSNFLCKYTITNSQTAQKQPRYRYYAPGTNDNIQEDDCSGDNQTTQSESNGVTFSCNNPACDRVFRTSTELERHNLGPTCSYRKYSQNMMDYVATVWIDKNSSSVFDKLDKRQHRTFATHLQTLQKVVIIATIPFFGDFIFLFVQGFAIKIQKEAFNYTDKIEKYVYKLWLIGEETGKKVQPPDAVQRLRHATVAEGSSELLFGVHEWLRESNIRYLYSKFGLKKKNNNKLPSTQRKSDTEWIENEQATQIAIESAQIISELQESVTTLLPLQEQDHPLLIPGTNLCDIAQDYVAKGTASLLFSMKMPKIRQILTKAGIIEGWTNRKKSAAEKILKLVKEHCSCC